MKLRKLFAAAVFAGATMALTACGTPKIDFDDYLTITATGYDGYGTLEASIDWDAIEEKYGDKLEYTDTGEEALYAAFAGDNTISALKDYVSIDVSEDENLSNGDVVTYTWHLGDVSSALNCEITGEDGEYEVSGLEEVDSFDAFADLEVTFEGVAPNGTINMVYNGSELSSSDFTADTSSGLNNGDTVTVSISSDAALRCIEANGVAPSPSTQTYTVEGVQSYVKSLSEISDEAMEAMEKQAEDTWMADGYDSFFGAEAQVNAFDHIGNYLLTIKDEDSYGYNNLIYLVYKASLEDPDDSSVKADVYWYICYRDLTTDGMGTTTVDTNSYDKPYDEYQFGEGGLFSVKFRYDGYGALDELYKECVTENLEKYNHEDDVTDTASSAGAEDTTEEADTEEATEDEME